jgi:hypothetical protein
MGYVRRIVCLANSLKKGGYCIAGREVRGNGFGPWIRPVSERKSAEVWLTECLYDDSSAPALLDIIDVPLLRPAPHGHQTENHILDPASPWIKAGSLPRRELSRLLEYPQTLWSNRCRTANGQFDCVKADEAAAFEYSLVLVRPEQFTFIAGERYRGDFQYRGVRYNMSVTDPVTIAAFSARGPGKYPLSEVCVCVSLTEPYDKDGRCHKLAAAIIDDSAA